MGHVGCWFPPYWVAKFHNLFHSSTDRLLSDPELSAAESPLADKKAPGSERAAERAAAAQHNSDRARLAPRPAYINMQVMAVTREGHSHLEGCAQCVQSSVKQTVIQKLGFPSVLWSGGN